MAQIEQAFGALKSLLGDRLSTGASVRELHSRDEAHHQPHLPDAVAFPDCTEEVAQILRLCETYNVPMVPFGIGSSLEGQVIPVAGGLSLDMSRMNKVLSVNAEDLDVVVQPGVTRTELNAALKSHGLMFTVDPGADATLGGMASTRASGTNTVRYGTMRENTLALEVVLASGEVIRTGNRARKSSVGYDLTHLMVGAEGTLGVITELTLRLFAQPDSILSATCAFDGIDDAVALVIAAIQMDLKPARIELLDEVQMQGMARYSPELGLPEIPHLFLEFHGDAEGVKRQLDLFAELGAEFGMKNLAWATKAEERNQLWKARHTAYYAGKSLRPGCDGLVTDCCVPISTLAEAIARSKALVAEAGLIAPLVGHVGDGNFHLLILVDPENAEEMARAQGLAGAVSQVALDLGGAVSSEHGVGLGKRKYMAAQHGAAYEVMGAIKRALDPKGILNPQKIFL